MSKTNKDNFKDNVQNMSRKNLPIPSNSLKSEADMITEALIEGNKILEDEEKVKKSAKKLTVDDVNPLDIALGLKSPNPYVRARNQILQKWMKDPSLQWKAREIEKMENGTNPKNQFYDEFILVVAELGDKLSDEKV